MDCSARFQVADDSRSVLPQRELWRPSARRRPRRGPGQESCSTCLRRASPVMSACDAPGHAMNVMPPRRAAQSPMVRLIFQSDVRDVLPAVRVPTLVPRRADAATATPRTKATTWRTHVEGSAYVELPGTDDLIWAGNQGSNDRSRDRQPLSFRCPSDAGAEAGAGDCPVHRHRGLHEARRGTRRYALAGGSQPAL